MLGELRHYAYSTMLFAGLGFLTAAGALPYVVPPSLLPPTVVMKALVVLTAGGFAVGVACSLVGWLHLQYGLGLDG